MSNKKLKKKWFIHRQAIRIHKHEIKRRRKRKHTRISSIPKKAKRKTKEKRNRDFIIDRDSSDHKVFTAPKVFSLRTNPIEVIDYFSEAREALQNGYPCYFDLSHIIEMGPETLTFSCAVFSDENFQQGNAIQGNVPKDKQLKKMFHEAGFYNFVHPKRRVNYSHDLTGTIHRFKRKQVEPETAGEICKSAMQHTYSETDPKNQKFYRILIECMANTHNHSAYGESKPSYYWWLLGYKEPQTKVTKFCFLDLGVGVFGSLEQKYKDGQLAEYIKKVFKPNRNKETLREIFAGERKTSTFNQEGRGQGLNYIYKLAKSDKHIRNFTLLSNNIMAKIAHRKTDRIEVLKSDFRGTMYYWEIVPNS